MRNYSKFWGAGVVACLATLVLAALLLPKSFFLTALSDCIQCLLLLSGTLALVPRALGSRGHRRLFWTLMATGISFWFSYQLFWTCYEVWLRTDVPDLCAADIILFLHIVPLMAALALRPHAPQDEYAARLRHLDFALLTVWWVYLYVLIVIPFQYVVADVTAYGENLNLLYLIEKLAFLIALFFAWWGSKDGWKVFYANLFGASFLYSISSYIANWALSRHSYYSGSLCDIPLAISMAWITGIALWSGTGDSQTAIRSTSISHRVWIARLGMIATFSLPLFAAWALVDGPIARPIRGFRLVLTLATSLLMGGMVFVRQRLLDRELRRLLKQSRDSIANLKHLETQIMESEKLASVGQLVGGAAHELNNPITAMLGYSDLLRSTPLNPEQNELVERIGQHVRRTRELVASLISFAKQSPTAMVPVDLNALLRTAVKLSQPQAQALKIDVRSELPREVILVRGDSNQLLQVCVQAIHDAVHAAAQCGAPDLIVVARLTEGIALIAIGNAAIAGRTSEPSCNELPAVASSEAPSGFEQSTCEAIVRQHHGRVSWSRSPGAGLSIRLEIPAILASPENVPRENASKEKSTGGEPPALLQPQSSA